MAKTCYDPSLDEQIFVIIESNDDETTFNTLVDLLSKSPRTISKHIDFLTNKKNLLIWTKNQRGKRGSIKFTNNAKRKRSYNFLTVDYGEQRTICSEWNKNHLNDILKERKKKKILFLLFISMSSYGSIVSKKVEPGKGVLGDVIIRDSKGNPFYVDREEGFSPNEDDELNTNPSFSDTFSNINNKRFTRLEIKKIINEIREKDDIQLRPVIGKDGKMRYVIDDNELRELLSWSMQILTNYLFLMQLYWLITSTIPKNKDERQWFREVVGDDLATQFFGEIDENRRNRRTIQDLYIENVWHYSIDSQPANKIIRDEERVFPKIFTKNGMKKKIFHYSNRMSLIKTDCQTIAKDIKIQHMIEEKKYEWIMEDLINIINPIFSRNLFQVKLN